MELMKAHPERPRTADDYAWSREFARLYRQWYRPVVSLCREYGGSSVDAEALAQEAFTRAWLAWERFSTDRPFGPWIVTIARRVCLDHLARMERLAETLHHSAALFDPPAVSPAEGIAAAMDTAAVVNTILRTLPPRQRQVLELREIEGWSYEHIAQATGASVDGVRGVLRRARRSFKAAFAQIEGPIGGLGLVIARVRHATGRWRLPRGETVNALSQWASAELGGLLVPLMLAWGATVPAADAATTTVTAAASSPAGAAAPTETDHRSARSVSKALPAAATAVASAGRPVVAEPPASAISDSITSIAVSPSYQEDRTVYASGVSDCGVPHNCPVLYRSTDGGGTWALLPAVGRAEGQVMVPPAYPRDRRIFSAGISELQVSDDDGRTFRTLALTRGAAAMSPQFSDGDPRIFFGRSMIDLFVAAGLEYHDGVGVKPLSLSLPLGAGPEHFAFSETYAADGAVLIGGKYVPPGMNVAYSAVFECVHDECRTHDLGVAVSSPKVVGRSAGHPEALAATPFRLFRSPADGAAFEPIKYPVTETHGTVVEDIIRLADGTLLVSVHVDQRNRRGRLYSSHDSGDTWSPVTPADGVAFDKLVQLPDGRLLGAGVVGVGLFCSDDAGRTWAPTCA
jgi:RNA polymerase sigma-70 factor (ECF subfamily)